MCSSCNLQHRCDSLRVPATACNHSPTCPASCCAIPVGRTAHYFDIDLVADIRAHQSCWQLCLNEGSLHFGRMQGGDASHDGTTHAFFNAKYVPEVFSYFDALSYDLSKMDLTAFRQNAMRNDIMRGGASADTSI